MVLSENTRVVMPEHFDLPIGLVDEVKQNWISPRCRVVDCLFLWFLGFFLYNLLNHEGLVVVCCLWIKHVLTVDGESRSRAIDTLSLPRMCCIGALSVCTALVQFCIRSWVSGVIIPVQLNDLVSVILKIEIDEVGPFSRPVILSCLSQLDCLGANSQVVATACRNG